MNRPAPPNHTQTHEHAVHGHSRSLSTVNVWTQPALNGPACRRSALYTVCCLAVSPPSISWCRPPSAGAILHQLVPPSISWCHSPSVGASLMTDATHASNKARGNIYCNHNHTSCRHDWPALRLAPSPQSPNIPPEQPTTQTISTVHAQ